MPIPKFDGILNILPPHRGNPTQRADLSPYICTMCELCKRFATTEERKEILEGFLDFRKELFYRNIKGFQWIAGSFVEDIEMQESRPPRDIDVITFVSHPATPREVDSKMKAKTDLTNIPTVKSNYKVDHYLVSLGSPSVRIVAATKYWYGCFTHRRDAVWKGILMAELKDKLDDVAARQHLKSTP